MTCELLKLCLSPQKAQTGSRVYKDTGFLLCWVSSGLWAQRVHQDNCSQI